MPKQIIIAEQHRIAAVFSEDLIQEIIVATGSHQVGDIYLGVVENVLPGIDAAFVNIGDPQRNGFIHVTDLGPLRLKRSAGAITELLVPQQKVLIQVMKEPTGNKGPRLTGNITLPGRYLVLMPFGRGVNLSRRIRNENERSRLRALAILIKPAGMGLLVRTEAEGVPEEAIIEDLETLQKQWEAVQQRANSTRAPAMLNRDDDFVQRVLRDVYSANVNRIVVDSQTGLKRVKQHLMNWSGGRLPQGVFIDHHHEPSSILEYFRVNAAIREALKPRVDLPSGGYIIIERTEALTVIDVNSGSFTRSATARETVLWTNCEAATEIARQLRLRNVAGVIIVDFIDMDSRRDQFQVLEHFNKALRSDKARPQIAQLSELGLVELTRKRQGQNIYELFGRTCPTCGGLGHLVYLPGETPSSDGEMVERYPTLRTQDYLPAVEPHSTDLQAAQEFPREGSDPELSDSMADLDLTNHPSYQEQGDAGASRRRRRNRVGDVVLKPTNSKAQEETPIASPRNTVVKPDSISEQTNRASTSKEKLGSLDRAKPNQPEESRPTIESPEVISVEMTPEEQDVYAFMGISPLVRFNGKVKNSKSMVVSVTPPGGSTTAPSPEGQPVATLTKASTATSNSQTNSLPESTAVTAEIEPTEIKPALEMPTLVEPLVEAEVDESASDASVTRRRRRRSSAKETQLPLEIES